MPSNLDDVKEAFNRALAIGKFIAGNGQPIYEDYGGYVDSSDSFLFHLSFPTDEGYGFEVNNSKFRLTKKSCNNTQMFGMIRNISTHTCYNITYLRYLAENVDKTSV